jgi:ATP-dependent Clp protease ATP-binding subunit ClpA
MKNKLESQFSETTLHVLKNAEYEAMMYPRPDQQIGTEHLLLALFEIHPTLNYLRSWLGLDRDVIKSRVRQMAKVIEYDSKRPFELSNHLKQVIKLALKEMKARDHQLLYPQHLLFGLTQVPDCTAMMLIREFGVGKDELQRQTERLMKRGIPNLSAQQKALSIYEDLFVDSTEFHKWEFRCTVIESISNQAIANFKLNALDLWDLKYGFEEQNKLKFERKIAITHPNTQYHLVISLEEVQI